MKVFLIVLLLYFMPSFSTGKLHQHSKFTDSKDGSKDDEKLSKKHRHLYKKYALMMAPALEGTPQQQPSAPQAFVQQQPLTIPQTTQELPQATQEMVSTYSPADTSQASQQAEDTTQQQVVDQQPSGVLQSSTEQEPLSAQVSGEQGTAMLPESTQDEASSQGVTLQDPSKETEAYNTPENKVDGVSPQEQVKVVSLGDDDQKAAQEPCGGCPAGAQCVNGECQIREEEAQKLAAKGTASNPESASNVHNLETQELNSLLNEATKADPAPGTNPETGSPELTTSSPDTGITEQVAPSSADTTHSFTTSKPDDTMSTSNLQSPSSSTSKDPSKAIFSETEIHELREFARMYKMYQFIRKIEQKLNDPDCAPICRVICRSFCPEKCCRSSKKPESVANNGTLVTPQKPKNGGKLDATLVEDNSKDDDLNDEKKMNAARKHVFVKIENTEDDKPRNKVS